MRAVREGIEGRFDAAYSEPNGSRGLTYAPAVAYGKTAMVGDVFGAIREGTRLSGSG